MDASETSGGEVGQGLPPVVAVVVTHRPGAWFDDVLASFAGQSYRNLSFLFVDSGQDPGLAERIAAVLPDAHRRAAAPGRGFGATANEALAAVHGAAFFLLCHDDVRLDPDVVRVLVEEAFRSNAGIVGPKLVDWHDPSKLLSVGMGVDKTGYPAAYVDRGELDQEQHDAVRDAFYIPGAVTLVRADLFRTLGGFDEGIDYHGDDLDLCWRAQVAGARVVATPRARVAHLEALGERRPVDDRRRLQMRHRLRALRVSYRLGTRIRVLPQAGLLALAEVLYSLLLGRFRQARDVGGAWLWNERRRLDIRRRRSRLELVRSVPDSAIRRRQTRGSARMGAFLRGQIGSRDDRLPAVAGAGRSITANLRSSKARTTLLAWAVLALLLLVGSRDLVFGRLASVGELLPFGGSVMDLLQAWWSGYRTVGLGSFAATPTLVGAVGGLGVVAFGALELLRKVLVLGMVPLGLAGMWRLCRPIGSRRASIVGLVVYVAIPLPYNAIAGGSWTALAAYAGVPWMLSQICRASRLSPFGDVGGPAGPGVRSRPLVQRILAAGVMTACVAMVAPVAVLLVAASAVGLAVGGVLAGQLRGAGRMLLAGVGSAAVAVVLHLPWSLTFVSSDWAATAGAPGSREVLEVADLLHFTTGPVGGGVFGFLFLAAAALALLIGRDWRLSWAVRGWTLAAIAFGAAAAQVLGVLPSGFSSVELVLVPAAAGLALATAMGMAAFEVDLRDYHFGSRQLVSLLAGAALVLATLPVLVSVTDGRWEQPRGDYAQALDFMDVQGASEPFRVLWVGEQPALPLPGWAVDAAGSSSSSPSGAPLAFATSENGTASLQQVLPGEASPATARLRDLLRIAVEGGTSRLGGNLAEMGVRYIVVPLAEAPQPFAQPTNVPLDLLAVLDGQLDLARVTAAGTIVYRNNEWGPTRAAVPVEALAEGGAALGDPVDPAVSGAPAALPDDDGFQSFSGEVDPGGVFLSAPSSSNWRLEVAGTAAQRSEVLGWANGFEVGGGGAGRLWYDTPVLRHVAVAGQVALWVAAIVILLRVRVLRDEDRRLPGAAVPGRRRDR